MLSIFLFLILFTLLIRSLTKAQPKPPQKVLTLIQCTKCAFKSVRDFQVGDYIPKVAGSCPNCGSIFQIEAIYVEEPVKKESKESLTF
ncbi:MAG: hypothetical protein N3E48_04860 [Candidatus Bathyarchaeota archaeon]|nr:hypothetical protein [Candidatus Bathyarchaeota archaeon]